MRTSTTWWRKGQHLQLQDTTKCHPTIQLGLIQGSKYKLTVQCYFCVRLLPSASQPETTHGGHLPQTHMLTVDSETVWLSSAHWKFCLNRIQVSICSLAAILEPNIQYNEDFQSCLPAHRSCGFNPYCNTLRSVRIYYLTDSYFMGTVYQLCKGKKQEDYAKG